MLYAISGSQGSGKSSVLKELESRGFNILKRKISRSILSDWNVSLNEVNSDEELSLKFQDEILLRKFQDEKPAVESNKIYFTERTYLDSFVYYMYTFGCRTKFSDNIDTYYNTCVEYDKNYTSVFVLPFGKFPIEDDGVRNPNRLYTESIDVVLKNFLRKTMADRLYDVNEHSIIERADYIERVAIQTKNNLDK